MKSCGLFLMLIAGGAIAAEDPHAHHKVGPNPVATTAEPVRPTDYAADRIFGADVMAAARAHLRHEHGAHVLSKVMIDKLEYAAGRKDEYRWEGEAWIGGDINRAVLKTKGEGGNDLHHVEVHGLYSRAIGPYFDLQGGLRHDVRPSPSRTYAALGLEGLAPYWFEVEATAFISDKGDVIGRLEASYDQLITSRLVLEPQAELNLSAQRIAALGTGSGVTEAELGVRLRYEIRREFAPYLGLWFKRKVGATADAARAAGEAVENTSVVLGIRTWF